MRRMMLTWGTFAGLILLCASVARGDSLGLPGEWLTGPSSSVNGTFKLPMMRVVDPDPPYYERYSDQYPILWSTDQGFPVLDDAGTLQYMVFGDTFPILRDSTMKEILLPPAAEWCNNTEPAVVTPESIPPDLVGLLNCVYLQGKARCQIHSICRSDDALSICPYTVPQADVAVPTYPRMMPYPQVSFANPYNFGSQILRGANPFSMPMINNGESVDGNSITSGAVDEFLVNWKCEYMMRQSEEDKEDYCAYRFADVCQAWVLYSYHRTNKAETKMQNNVFLKATYSNDHDNVIFNEVNPEFEKKVIGRNESEELAVCKTLQTPASVPFCLYDTSDPLKSCLRCEIGQNSCVDRMCDGRIVRLANLADQLVDDIASQETQENIAFLKIWLKNFILASLGRGTQGVYSGENFRVCEGISSQSLTTDEQWENCNKTTYSLTSTVWWGFEQFVNAIAHNYVRFHIGKSAEGVDYPLVWMLDLYPQAMDRYLNEEHFRELYSNTYSVVKPQVLAAATEIAQTIQGVGLFAYGPEGTEGSRLDFSNLDSSHPGTPFSWDRGLSRARG